jgi:cellulose synthase operon protein YhjQ
LQGKQHAAATAGNREGTQMPEDQPELNPTCEQGHAHQTGFQADLAVLPLRSTERMARSIWQANRIALDAPHWFGLLPNQNESEAAELPQQFGIVTDDLIGDGIGGKTAGVAAAGNGREAQESQKRSVLAFPQGFADPGATTVLRRAQEVLPFRAPAARKTIAIFSLVGGVGATSLAAGLTRVLAYCGERILLADADGHSLLPHYFGGKGSRQGSVRKFVSRSGSKNEVISTVSLDVESFAGQEDEQDRMLEEFNGEAARMDRVLWDLGNAPADWVVRILRQGVRVIVPLLPTAKCLMQLPATERILQRSQKPGSPAHWQYLLNQFDERDPAQVDIRTRFRQELGDRLLPFMLRSSPLVNEALLCGRTVVDHAPACPLVSDLWRLARSVAGLAQPFPSIMPESWGEN